LEASVAGRKKRETLQRVGIFAGERHWPPPTPKAELKKTMIEQ